jgi:glycosyltransferase involved in cell wall biosynthesis
LLSKDNKSAPKVAILLCTYHGQRYLTEQLDSFASQVYPNWDVWASDDGSQDDTHAILENYRANWGERLSIHRGPEEGFSANFLSMICNAGIQSDYYAYSDQDDIWETDKLQHAMDWLLLSVPGNIPALYCSRTRLVDADNRDIGFSPLFSRLPSFANALVQNIGGGNTMVFNDATRSLLREAGEYIDVASHDWWTYMVVSGCGGRVFYDSYPSTRYRQHDGNVVGMNSSWAARFVRVRLLFQGRFRNWSDRNIRALQRLRSKLTPENRQILDRFATARNRWMLPRLIGIKRSGIYRQTVWGNLGLIAAAIFKKI